MKTLFRLKKIPYFEYKYMTNEQAEKEYKGSKYPSRVSSGFYSKKLEFHEWMDRYKIKIL